MTPEADGRIRSFRHARIETRSTHGTGCTLSSAVAARLASGEPLERAVEGGIEFLLGAMASAYPLGSGHGPVNHLYRLEPAPEGVPSPSADRTSPDRETVP